MVLEALLELRNLEVEFLLGTIQSKIHKLHLEYIHTKYQVFPEFEMEVSLKSDRACNPPLGKIVLYKKYFSTRLRLLVFFFFIDFLHVVRLPPCALVPNAWRFIYDFIIIVF